MASAYFVLPVWVAVAASGARWSTSTILFTLAITLIGIARLLLKDYRDLDGDKKLGKATPLIIYGPRVVKYLVILFLPLGLIVLCTLLGKEKSFSVVESLAIMLVALVGLAASLVATRSTQAQGDHPRSVIATFLLQRLALVLILVSVLLG
jgi:4-hydroxybenzoate polyprenyltransferase